MRKAQNLIISAIVLSVFLIMAISLFSSQFFSLFGTEDIFKELQDASSNIGSSLADEPVPLNWNESNVKKLGLMFNGVIDEDSLRRYGALSYSKSKLLLGMHREYLFFFTNGSLVPIEIEDKVNSRKFQFWGWNGKGKPNGGPNLTEVFELIIDNSENMAKDERFVSLRINNTINEVKLITYVWDFMHGNATIFAIKEPLIYDFSAFLNITQGSYTIGDIVYLTGVS